MWIVRPALRRPYTFVVMAVLIAILGGTARAMQARPFRRQNPLAMRVTFVVVGTMLMSMTSMMMMNSKPIYARANASN